MWTLDPAAIQRIRFQGAAKFALEVKNGQWKVIDVPAPSFAADDMGLRNSVGPLLDLRAMKYVAFGGKIDLASFGLDKPIASVSVTLAEGPKDKTTEQVLEIGKEAPCGGRYAAF